MWRDSYLNNIMWDIVSVGRYILERIASANRPIKLTIGTASTMRSVFYIALGAPS